MHGWVFVLTLVNLILANAIVWFVVAMARASPFPDKLPTHQEKPAGHAVLERE